ncbi:MAG: hypothetical protein WC196_02750 [Bacilli bacterium]|jgi:hypothetical protein
MDMSIKEFCQKAIENGYRKTNTCTGWDWIKNNLAELDYIFQTEEYKSCDGMRYKCMPLLLIEELTNEEEDALSTAWYLQNDRQREFNRQTTRQRFLGEGWQLLTSEIILNAISSGKKLCLKAAACSDWLTVSVDGIFRPHNNNGRLFLIAPKCRRKGYSFETLIEYGKRDAFCKIV